MEDEDFKILRAQFKELLPEEFKMLRYKGSIPYSFYTSHEDYKCTELREDMFYNDLTKEYEPESYKKCKELWNKFNIKDHGELIDLCIITS